MPTSSLALVMVDSIRELSMLPAPQSPPRLAFGNFEVNVAAAQLLKSGIRIRLSSQPFQILLILLAHPGDVVTRERLREQVWSDGTFVDFEHSLNAAINKLRNALSDSAENPRGFPRVDDISGHSANRRGTEFVSRRSPSGPGALKFPNPVP